MLQTVKFTVMFGTLFLVVTHAYVLKYHSLSSVITGVYDYHRTIGIPLAREIKKNERELISRQRITGGLPTEIDAVPYQAGLIISINNNLSVCGGSIISDTRILTAAHCYSDGISTAQTINVVLGSTYLFFGGTRVIAEDVIAHSGFDPSTAENDIAILKVPSVTFSSQIQPLVLPSSEVNMDFTGYQAVASGFGMTSDDEEVSWVLFVSSVTVPVIGNEACLTAYGGFILDQHICTDGINAKGTCRGDSGGPLVVNIDSRTVLIGITSFGAEFCTASYPSAYVRVTKFLDWISVHID